MSYDTKQLADKLIQLNNSTQILNDIISALESSENTVKDDIRKLIDGAKLEPQFDLSHMSDLAGDISSDVYSAGDHISSIAGYIEEAQVCISDAQSNADELCSMIEDIQYKLKEDDEEGSD